MIFFSRHRGPLVRGSTPSEQALRFLLLIGVFGLVAWLFWQNTEKSMDAIQSRGTVWDQTESLDSDTRSVIREFATHFQDQYGIELKIHVTNEPDAEDRDLDPKTLLISVYPEREQVRIVAPRYLALDPGLLRYLETDFFAFYFEQEAWTEGLVQAMLQIVAALEGEGGESGEDREEP